MKIAFKISELNIVRSFHLHRSKRADWIDGIYWLISTFVSGLMPVWLPFLLLWPFHKNPSLISFTKEGGIALICASLISASVYTITKESRWNFLRELFADIKINKMNETFPNQRLFIFLTFILTLTASTIYLGGIISKLPGIGLTIDSGLVNSLSWALFFVTLLISFFIIVIDNAFTNRPDITELRGESIVKLETQFKAVSEDK